MDHATARTAIAEVLGTIAPEIDLASLDPAAPLRAQVDLDSVDFLNFVVGLHERCRVEIPEADYQKLDTLDRITAYLVAHAQQ